MFFIWLLGFTLRRSSGLSHQSVMKISSFAWAFDFSLLFQKRYFQNWNNRGKIWRGFFKTKNKTLRGVCHLHYGVCHTLHVVLTINIPVTKQNQILQIWICQFVQNIDYVQTKLHSPSSLEQRTQTLKNQIDKRKKTKGHGYIHHCTSASDILLLYGFKFPNT